jgi:hypothetical protein
LFELRPSGDTRDDELIGEARLARNAGQANFQFFAAHAGRRSPENRDDEFETARLVDLLEAERWTLENVADAGELDNPALGVLTVRSVGTIYTAPIAAWGFEVPQNYQNRGGAEAWLLENTPYCEGGGILFYNGPRTTDHGIQSGCGFFG